MRRWSPPARLKQPLRALLAQLGFEAVRLHRPATAYMRRLIDQHQISVIIDVGANQGQYASRMRVLGYSGRIVSFEPGSEAHSLLLRHSKRDPMWQVFNCALGRVTGARALYVSRDSVSSSLLQVVEPHVRAAPDSVASYSEVVEVRRLDDLVLLDPSDRAWLKLDTQGTEHDILLGSEAILPRTRVVQCEVSLMSCYEQQADYRDVFDLLHRAGFRLAWVEPGTQLPDTGAMLQFDAIFQRALADP